MRRFFNNPWMLIMVVLLLFENLRYSDLLTNPANWILRQLLILPGIVIGLSLHEFAHALVSDRLGDPTPRNQGRLTVNPAAHIDPVGFLALLFIGFGWGQAVQINPSYYKKQRRDETLVALAGVTMNLLLAVLFTGVLKVTLMTGGGFLSTRLGGILLVILQQVISINIVLMVFNLMPIPPLDGFNVIANVFHFRNDEIYYRLIGGGMVLLMLVIVFDIPSRVLSPIVGGIIHLFYQLFRIF